MKHSYIANGNINKEGTTMAFSIHMTGKVKLKLPGVIQRPACFSKTRQHDGHDGFPLFRGSKV